MSLWLSILTVCFLLYVNTNRANGLKVLVQVLTGGQSHVRHAAAMVDALVDRGHIVDVLVPIHNPRCKINGTMKYRKIFWVQHAGLLPFHKVPYLNKRFDQTFHTKFDPAITESNMILCDDALDNAEMMEELKSEHYDVGLFGALTPCFAGILHLIGTRSYHSYMPLASDGIYQLLGIPVPASYISGSFSIINKRSRMSFLERAQSLIAHWKFNYYIHAQLEQENQVFKRRFPNFPHLTDIFKNITYYFENSDPLLTIPQPYSEKIKFIGGIGVKPVQPLNEEYNSLLEKGRRGVVLFSFGSLLRIEQVPIDVQREILESFSQFPDYLFIWKHDRPDLIQHLMANHTNVQTVQWLPQNDLLNDKRVRLFITHVGMNSYMESMRAAVPLVAIPLFADQPSNAAAVEEKGMGVVIQPKQLNKRTLTAAISEVLDNESYRDRALEMSRRLKRKRQPAKEYFADLIEYSTDHPTLGQDLQLAAHDMDLITYFCVDVLAAFLCVGIAALYLVYRLVRAILRTANAFRQFVPGGEKLKSA